MRVKKDTITINGRIYDSKTGDLIETPKKVEVKTSQASSPVIAVEKATTVGKKKSATRSSVVKANAIHTRTERAKTLSRAAVKKPAAPKKAKSATGPVSQPTRIIVHTKGKQTPQSTPTIIRSSRISKFNHAPISVVHKANVPIVPAPRQKTTPRAQHRRYDIADTPPATHHQTVKKPAHHKAANTENIFETALKTATSHKTTHKATAKQRRVSRLGLAGLSLLILGIFFTYQNAPRIALYRAQSTIGFEASIPGYNPSGFRRVGPVQYQKGMVVLNFQSNSDDRQYTVTQTATALNNSELADGYLTATGKQFETTSIDNKTIYIYDNSRATWINQGVWYTIDGNAHLGKDQLTNIIASI